MTSQPCTLIQSQLPLHAGGELEPDEADAVAEHLASCGACHALFGALQRQCERLAAADLPVPQDVPSVWPAVRAALEREGRFAPRATEIAPDSAPASATSAALARVADLPTPAPARPRGGLPRAWRFASAISAVAAALLAFALLRPDDRPAPIVEIPLGAGEPAASSSEVLAVREPSPAPEQLGGLRRLAPSEPTLAELPAGAAFAPSLLPIDPADAGATLATDRRLR